MVDLRMGAITCPQCGEELDGFDDRVPAHLRYDCPENGPALDSPQKGT